MSFTFLAPHAILRRATDARAAQRRIVAGIDLAFVHDGCALVTLEMIDAQIITIDYDFRLPKPGQPLDPVSVCAEYMDRLESKACKNVAADVHYLELLRSVASKRGITMHNAPSGDGRTQAFTTLRHMTREKSIRFPRVFLEHLRKIKQVVGAGGQVSIQAPRPDGGPGKTEGVGHADLAFALVAGAWLMTRLYGQPGTPSTQIKTHSGKWGSP